MFFSENDYQLPRRAQTWSGWLALSRKLTTQRLMPLSLAIGFLRMCMRARRPQPRYPKHSQGVYIYPWEWGVRGLSVGVAIKEPLLKVQKRFNLLYQTS